MKIFSFVLAVLIAFSPVCVVNATKSQASSYVQSSRNDVPMFRQHDQRWANKYYGPQTFKDSACAVCAASMVITWLRGEVVLPDEVANFSLKHGHVGKNGGTDVSWFFEMIAWQYGFELELTYDPEVIRRALKQGRPVIAGHGPGLFTDSSHAIVYVGFDIDGKVVVNDPAGGQFCSDDVTYEFEQLVADSYGYWWIVPERYLPKKPKFDAKKVNSVIEYGRWDLRD